jgi:hypothetical protein
MGRFYFDFIEGSRVVSDDGGAEFSTPEAATVEAIKVLPEMMPCRIAQLTKEKSIAATTDLLAIKVRNDDGPVLVIRLTLEIERIN